MHSGDAAGGWAKPPVVLISVRLHFLVPLSTSAELPCFQSCEIHSPYVLTWFPLWGGCLVYDLHRALECGSEGDPEGLISQSCMPLMCPGG